MLPKDAAVELLSSCSVETSAYRDFCGASTVLLLKSDLRTDLFVL